MVLQVRCPRGMTLRRLIESHFKKWGCKTFPPYTKWLSISRAATLLEIPEHKVLRLAANSKTVHGLFFNDEPLIIHPHCVFKRVAYRESCRISARLKRDALKIGDSITEPTSNT